MGGASVAGTVIAFVRARVSGGAEPVRSHPRDAAASESERECQFMTELRLKSATYAYPFRTIVAIYKRVDFRLYT